MAGPRSVTDVFRATTDSSTSMFPPPHYRRRRRLLLHVLSSYVSVIALVVVALMLSCAMEVVTAVEDRNSSSPDNYDNNLVSASSDDVNEETDGSSQDTASSSACARCCESGGDETECMSAFKGTPGQCCGGVFETYYCCPVARLSNATSPYGDSHCLAARSGGKLQGYRCRAAASGQSSHMPDHRHSMKESGTSLFWLLLLIVLPIAGCAYLCSRRRRTTTTSPAGYNYGDGASPAYHYGTTGVGSPTYGIPVSSPQDLLKPIQLRRRSHKCLVTTPKQVSAHTRTVSGSNTHALRMG